MMFLAFKSVKRIIYLCFANSAAFYDTLSSVPHRWTVGHRVKYLPIVFRGYFIKVHFLEKFTTKLVNSTIFTVCALDNINNVYNIIRIRLKRTITKPLYKLRIPLRQMRYVRVSFRCYRSLLVIFSSASERARLITCFDSS
jgi:hypothetical protein